MSAQSDDDHTVRGGPNAPQSDMAVPQPYTPRQLFWLKMLVGGLGVAILLAFVGMIAGVLHVREEIAARKAAEAAAAPAATDRMTPSVRTQQRDQDLAAPAKPPGGGTLPRSIALKLPADARVQTLELSGNRIAIAFTSNAGDGIVIVAVDTGRVLQRIRITPRASDPSANSQ